MALLKLLMVGDKAVGKSQLYLRYSRGVYVDHLPSRMQWTDTVELDGKPIKLQTCDLDGIEHLKVCTSSNCQDGAIVVYDVTKRESFERVSSWVLEIEKYASPGIPTIIVGTGCDDVHGRTVSQNEAQALATSLGLTCMEVSARTGHHVEAAFLEIISAMRDFRKASLGAGLTFALSGKIDNGMASLKLTSLAGKTVASLDLHDAAVKPWAEVRPMLIADLLLSKGQRPRFLLPDGSLADASADALSVAALLQLKVGPHAGGCGLAQLIRALRRRRTGGERKQCAGVSFPGNPKSC